MAESRMSSESLLKRGIESDETGPDPKHAKTNSDPETATDRVMGWEETEPNSPKNPGDEATPLPGAEISEWEDEEIHWIKCYYQLLLSAVTNHPCKAPDGSVSCAYFNAYFEGHIPQSAEEGHGERYLNRTFDDFRREVSKVDNQTYEQVTRRNQQHIQQGITAVFYPTVTPKTLAAYTEIHERYAVKGEVTISNNLQLSRFIERIVQEQLLPHEPSWIEDARKNVRRRSALNLSDYTAVYSGRLSENETPDVVRMVWYEDRSTRDSPDDYLMVSHGTSKKGKRFKIVRRKVHAAAGNALLNMAIIPPDGYDGDLKDLVNEKKNVELPPMDQQQRVEFDDHIRAVRFGNELRNQLSRRPRGNRMNSVPMKLRLETQRERDNIDEHQATTLRHGKESRVTPRETNSLFFSEL